MNVVGSHLGVCRAKLSTAKTLKSGERFITFSRQGEHRSDIQSRGLSEQRIRGDFIPEDIHLHGGVSLFLNILLRAYS